MTSQLREIDMIYFGVSSPEDIKKNSVCKINNTKTSIGSGTVYDEKMGAAVDGGNPCVTCGMKIDMCPGHFGYIELNQYIINPLFYKQVFQYLKCICMNTDCNHLLVNDEQIQLYKLNKYRGAMRFIKILERLEKVDICCHCKHIQPKLTYSTTDNTISMSYTKKNKDNEKMMINIETEDIKKIFDNISDKDVVTLGFDPTHVHPKNFILSLLPVAPPSIRPYVYTDGQICDDDLTIQYIEILKANNHLAEEGLDEKNMQKYLNTIKFRVSTLFDNSKGKAKHSQSNRVMLGIKERLTGKKGWIRDNLMGKRVDFSGRTPIGPDPTLKLGELGVPPYMANILTVPERVTNYNIEKLTKIVNNDEANFVINNNDKKINLKYALFRKGTELLYGDVVIRGAVKIHIYNQKDFKLRIGDLVERNGEQMSEIRLPEKKHFKLFVGNIVHRKLINGDYVLLNRQPTLHAGSMMAMQVVILPGKTLRLNLAATKSFNADFDGDEMNIHVPQGLEAQTELAEISAVKHHIISTQTSTPNIVIVQDSILGAFKMTIKVQTIPKHLYNDIVIRCDFSAKGYDFLKNKQRTIRSVLKKHNKKVQAYTGKGLFSLLFPDDFMYVNKNNGDSDEPIVKIERGVLYEGAITKANLGGGNQSLILILHKEYGKDFVSNFIDNVQFMTNNWLLMDGFTVGLGDCIATKEDDIEDAVKRCFIKAKRIEKSTHHPGIREMRVAAALNEAKDIGLRIAKDALGIDNNFVTTVGGGSKGEYFNIGQITGLLGQQNLEGKRIPLMLNQGRRSLPHYVLDQKLSTESEYESRGFVKSSFIKGLNPREFYFHAMTGREGITDTAMKTARSGYIQRKIVKCLEDIQVTYDGTVRDTVGSTYQLSYGTHGFDPARSININGESECCDISRIVGKINMKREKFVEEELDMDE
jgi:DNA-directed RNA polymerase beta' subunit